jgi:plastocyanin
MLSVCGRCALVSAIGLASIGATAAGTIEGTVRFVGDPPEPLPIVLTNGEMRLVDVNTSDQGLRSAVVSVADATSESTPASLPAVTITQRGYVFIPMILAIREGQRVRFTNEDSANHSVRSTDRFVPNRFGIYTGTNQDYQRSFTVNPSGRPIVLGCDIHDWMVGWIYVFNHPFYTMTDGNGKFTITGVVTGKHTLSVRHPGGSLHRDVDIVVETGKPAHVDVLFNASDLGSPVQ